MKILYKNQSSKLSPIIVELGLGDSGDWNRWMEI